MRLKDKVAIVTGAAHGMGEAEARLFAQEGAKVVIADALVKEGEAVAADISASQRQARFVRTDVTLETDWQKLIAETIAAYGRLDILVNNAGISGSSVGDVDGLEGWQRLLAVNATSVFLGTKLAAARWRRRAEDLSSTSRPSLALLARRIAILGIRHRRRQCAITRRRRHAGTGRRACG